MRTILVVFIVALALVIPLATLGTHNVIAGCGIGQGSIQPTDCGGGSDPSPGDGNGGSDAGCTASSCVQPH